MSLPTDTINSTNLDNTNSNDKDNYFHLGDTRDSIGKRFLIACICGYTDIIDIILSRDASFVDYVDENGNTGLKKAVCIYYPWTIDVVTRLLQYGSDVDRRNNIGITPFTAVLSSYSFKPTLANMLLMHSKQGINALDDEDGHNHLSSCETLESFKFVIENGINLNFVEDESTFLDLFVSMNGGDNAFATMSAEVEEIVNYLRSQGAKTYEELL